MEKELICPYCKEPQRTHDPDQIDATMCFTECECCGKEFWYSVIVSRLYDSYQAEK